MLAERCPFKTLGSPGKGPRGGSSVHFPSSDDEEIRKYAALLVPISIMLCMQIFVNTLSFIPKTKTKKKSIVSPLSI